MKWIVKKKLTNFWHVSVAKLSTYGQNANTWRDIQKLWKLWPHGQGS